MADGPCLDEAALEATIGRGVVGVAEFTGVPPTVCLALFVDLREPAHVVVVGRAGSGRAERHVSGDVRVAGRRAHTYTHIAVFCGPTTYSHGWKRIVYLIIRSLITNAFV